MPTKERFIVRGKFVCPVKTCESPPILVKHRFASHLKQHHPQEYLKWATTPGNITKFFPGARAKMAAWATSQGLTLPAALQHLPRNGHALEAVEPEPPKIAIEDKLDQMLADLYAQRNAIDGKINTLLQLKKDAPLQRGVRPEGRLNNKHHGPRETQGLVDALAEVLRAKPLKPIDAFAGVLASGKLKDSKPDDLRRQVTYVLAYHNDHFRRLSSGAYTNRR